MAKKSTRPSSQPDPQRQGEPDPLDVSGAIRALREATRALAATTGPHAPNPPDETMPPDSAAVTEAGSEQPGDPPRRSPAIANDPDARAFYKQLEQNGQLADVADDTDLATLSPRVTHIRRSDGTIERIGFS